MVSQATPSRRTGPTIGYIALAAALDYCHAGMLTLTNQIVLFINDHGVAGMSQICLASQALS